MLSKGKGGDSLPLLPFDVDPFLTGMGEEVLFLLNCGRDAAPVVAEAATLEEDRAALVPLVAFIVVIQ